MPALPWRRLGPLLSILGLLLAAPRASAARGQRLFETPCFGAPPTCARAAQAAARRRPLPAPAACPLHAAETGADAGGAGAGGGLQPRAGASGQPAREAAATASRRAERGRRAPGPRPLPLVGNMLGMIRRGGVHQYDAYLYKRYGSVARSQLLGSPWYTVSTPELAREVLVTREADFATRFVPPVAMRIWGDGGIIFSSGTEHATNRRLTGPTLVRPDVLERATAIVVGFANRLADRYERLPAGTVVDIYDIMKSVALDAVSSAAFSLPLGVLGEEAEAEDAGGRQGPGEAANDSPPTGVVDGRRVDQLAHAAFGLVGEAIRNPIPKAELLGLNPAYRDAERAYMELRAAHAEVVAARRTARAAAASRDPPGAGPAAAPGDLLDVYLDAAEGGSGGSSGGGGRSLSEASLLRNVFDVFLAGGDTTAMATCGTLYEVVGSPRVLARVQEELAGLDLDKLAQMPPAVMASRLPYLEACIKEALRFYPPLAQLPRRAVRDTTLGGYFVPAGAVVAPSVTNLHADPSVWGPDAGQFRPERWLDPPGGLEASLPKGSYMPFGMGPRLCVGMRLAQAKILAVAAVLLKRIDWEAVPVPRPRRRRRRKMLLALWARVRGKEAGVGGGEDDRQAGPSLDIRYPGAGVFQGGVPLRVMGKRAIG